MTDPASMANASAAVTPTPVEDAVAATLSHKLFGTKPRRYTAYTVLLLALVALGLWEHRGVANALRESRAASLQATLDTDVLALQIWIEIRKDDAEQWALDPRVQSAARDLLAIAHQGGSGPLGPRLWQSPARAQLIETLKPFLQREGIAAFNLIDPTGLILMTQYEDYSGLRLRPQALGYMTEVFKGRTRFLRPIAEAERVADPRVVRLSDPISWIEVPLRDAAGNVIAALGFGRYTAANIDAILKAARQGRSGEAYAFDERGVMLSESRFADRLRELGLIPPGDKQGSAFNVQLRDPGGDLGAGYRPELELPTRPRTRLAALAIGSRDKNDADQQKGVILEPYRNYLGVETIGAWRWLPAYEMGIAIEVSAAEAYAPLRHIEIAVGVVMLLAAIAAVVALLERHAVARVKRRESRVRRIGQYALGPLIAEGGVGNVYLAQHALLKRPTALKVLKPHLATDEVIARFEREVQLASQLTHPNTIEIYDFGRTRDGVFYYAMEYLDGMPLQDLVEKFGPLPLARAVHIMRQLCASLREAHERSLVHRDIKPQNIMLCRLGGEYDMVKVLDFGLVKDLINEATRDLSQFARVLGTPLYMAPERIRNPRDVDARSDIYSVGAVAYFILTARRLFESESSHDLVNQVLNATPRRPSENGAQDIPAALEELVLSCLAKERANRPQSIALVIAALEHIATAYPWSRNTAEQWWRDHGPTRDDRR